MSPSAIVGFGYPAKKIIGRKNRKPIGEVAYLDRFGKPLNPAEL
jgi:hypothetical protein